MCALYFRLPHHTFDPDRSCKNRGQACPPSQYSQSGYEKCQVCQPPLLMVPWCETVAMNCVN